MARNMAQDKTKLSDEEVLTNYFSTLDTPDVTADPDTPDVTADPDTPDVTDKTKLSDEEVLTNYFSTLDTPDGTDTSDVTDTSDNSDEEEDDTIQFQELADDETYMNVLRKYGQDNKNSMGVQKEDESNLDYVKRFLHHTREFEWNVIDLGQQVDYLRTADSKKREDFGYLYNQIEKVPAFYEDGGTGTLNAIKEFGGAILFDPFSYLGFGASFVARKMASRAIQKVFIEKGKDAAMKEAAKYTFKNQLKTTAGRTEAAGYALEAGLGSVMNLQEQEIDMLSKKVGFDGQEVPEDYDYAAAISAGGIGLALGALGLVSGKTIGGGRSTDAIVKNAEAKALTRQKIQAEYKDRTKKQQAELAKALVGETTKATVNGIIDIKSGREVLERLSPSGELTEAQYKKELIVRTGDVITETVMDLAETGQLGKMIDEETKAMEVMAKVISDRLLKVRGKDGKITYQLRQEDELFDDALSSAISRQGITVDEFANSLGSTYSDAGTVLSTLGRIGKIMKGVRGLQIKEILKPSNADKAAVGTSMLWKFFKKVDATRIASMVVQPATTGRNIVGGGIRLTFETAADLMESTLANIGNMTKAVTTGNIESGKGIIRDIFRDGFGKLGRLASFSDTSLLLDDLLKYNPTLLARMNNTLQDIGDPSDVAGVVRHLNVLNSAQDIFFRKGIMTNHIDKRLRRSGIITDNPTGPKQFKSLEELTASGAQLPTGLLRDAMEEALEFTFTKMPSGKTPTSNIARKFIEFNQSLPMLPLPIGTGAFPFARFMANAIKFQYDYSGVGAFVGILRGGVGTYYSAMSKLTKEAGKKGEWDDAAVAAFSKAKEEVSKGVVGVAALYAAVKYRKENQEIPFYQYQADDGTLKDLRPVFPIAPYLAIADVLVKYTNNDFDKLDLKEVISTVTGVQSRTGASSFVLDNFGETVAALNLGGAESPDTERFGELTGQYVGELTGGLLTPARFVRDIIAAYDTEAAIVRSPDDINGIGFKERGVASFKNTIKKELPIFSKELAQFESPTRDQPIYRMSSLVGQSGAPRTEAEPNPVEKEMMRLGIKRYTLGAKTGDKSADLFVDRNLGDIVEKHMQETINRPEYKRLTDTQKTQAFAQLLSLYKDAANELGVIEAEQRALDTGVASNPFDRAKFNKLSSKETAIINEHYMEMYGKTVLEMVKEEPNVNHYKIAATLAAQLSKF